MMINEYTDIQNKQQVNIIFSNLSACLLIWCCLIFQVEVALQWVDNDLSVHKEFIGLYAVSLIESSSLVHVIKDTLLHLGLPMTKIRGQYYDGASNM